MNVAEITVTAWLTGKHRCCNKTKLIRDFLDGKKIPLPPPVLFETPPDPITKVFLKVWKNLSPLDRARVCCKAVELKDGTCAVPRQDDAGNIVFYGIPENRKFLSFSLADMIFYDIV